MRRKPEGARALVQCVAIWVKDGPAYGKLLADWMTDGRTEFDHNSIDYARFYPHQLTENFIEGRCGEAAQKIYNPAVHPREPYGTGRNIKRSPFYEREKALGGYFMELGGWERAHGYAANEHLLEKYGNRVPVRENEWDNRHFWRVSNAEHLAMSEDCGMVNLSHFYMFDVEGPDHVELMEWICAAKIGGDANIGKGIYTHFLDDEGMVRADLTVIRMADRCRVIDGADAGPRDFHYMKRMAEDKGWNVTITDVDRKIRHHRHLGPECPRHPEKGRRGSGRLDPENFPFAAIKQIKIGGKDVTAFRISYVGEQGWELAYALRGRPRRLGCAALDRRDGLRRRDLCQHAPHGKEPAPAERRSADRVQSDRKRSCSARRSRKPISVARRQQYGHRALASQVAMLCTLVMTDNIDSKGVARYPVGILADPGSRDEGDAGRRTRPPLLHHLHRLRPDHRQEHRARLPALVLLPAGPVRPKRNAPAERPGRFFY
jgi:hypothetical protein